MVESLTCDACLQFTSTTLFQNNKSTLVQILYICVLLVFCCCCRIMYSVCIVSPQISFFFFPIGTLAHGTGTASDNWKTDRGYYYSHYYSGRRTLATLIATATRPI
jgi:hypothetical protein